eukprot:764878-Hanusia_phi.AAC.1
MCQAPQVSRQGGGPGRRNSLWTFQEFSNCDCFNTTVYTNASGGLEMLVTRNLQMDSQAKLFQIGITSSAELVGVCEQDRVRQPDCVQRSRVLVGRGYNGSKRESSFPCSCVHQTIYLNRTIVKNSSHVQELPCSLNLVSACLFCVQSSLVPRSQTSSKLCGTSTPRFICPVIKNRISTYILNHIASLTNKCTLRTHYLCLKQKSTAFDGSTPYINCSQQTQIEIPKYINTTIVIRDGTVSPLNASALCSRSQFWEIFDNMTHPVIVPVSVTLQTTLQAFNQDQNTLLDAMAQVAQVPSMNVGVVSVKESSRRATTIEVVLMIVAKDTRQALQVLQRLTTDA